MGSIGANESVLIALLVTVVLCRARPLRRRGPAKVRLSDGGAARVAVSFGATQLQANKGGNIAIHLAGPGGICPRDPVR